ncbi:MAG: lysophospholipid acyltransferase family protein, partial [Actinomycetota bacterium]
LKGGWSLIVFPEGTRSRDGWVQPLRSGAAWLAVETGIPVVPIGITGSYQAMPPGRNWPVAGRKPVAVRLGRALRPLKGERVVDFQQRLRMGLAVTLDEERTSWWEAIRRAAEGRASDPSGPSAARWRRLWESHRPVARPPTAWPARKREP